MNGYVVALILAVIALALGVVARVRGPRTGSKGPALPTAFLLMPCAGIIGILPWILQLGDTVKIAASVTSIIMNLAATVMFVIQIVSRRRA